LDIIYENVVIAKPHTFRWIQTWNANEDLSK